MKMLFTEVQAVGEREIPNVHYDPDLRVNQVTRICINIGVHSEIRYDEYSNVLVVDCWTLGLDTNDKYRELLTVEPRSAAIRSAISILDAYYDRVRLSIPAETRSNEQIIVDWVSDFNAQLIDAY